MPIGDLVGAVIIGVLLFFGSIVLAVAGLLALGAGLFFKITWLAWTGGIVAVVCGSIFGWLMWKK